MSVADTRQPGHGESRLYINGELRPAEGGRQYENISPLTETVLGVAADASACLLEERGRRRRPAGF